MKNRDNMTPLQNEICDKIEELQRLVDKSKEIQKAEGRADRDSIVVMYSAQKVDASAGIHTTFLYSGMGSDIMTCISYVLEVEPELAKMVIAAVEYHQMMNTISVFTGISANPLEEIDPENHPGDPSVDSPE